MPDIFGDGDHFGGMARNPSVCQLSTPLCPIIALPMHGGNDGYTHEPRSCTAIDVHSKLVGVNQLNRPLSNQRGTFVYPMGVKTSTLGDDDCLEATLTQLSIEPAVFE